MYLLSFPRFCNLEPLTEEPENSGLEIADSGPYLLNGFDFFKIYFEWRDSENQQYCIDNNIVSFCKRLREVQLYKNSGFFINLQKWF